MRSGILTHMSKAQLESGKLDYHAHLEQSREFIQTCDIADAIREALLACRYAEAMMQFEAKYEEREFDSIESFDIVFQYAPVMLDKVAIDELADLLKVRKRIERDTAADMGQRLQGARSSLKSAYSCLAAAEKSSIAVNRLSDAFGGTQEWWRWILRLWQELRVIRLTTESSQLMVRYHGVFAAPVLAKCWSCGSVQPSVVNECLNQRPCPRCRVPVCLVMLSEQIKVD